MVSTHEQATNQESTHGSGVFIALVPWVLFTIIAEHGTLKIASVAALVIAAGISLPGIRAGRPKLLELGAVIAFIGFTAVAFTADASLGEFVERYARAIAAALLALIAFGSLMVTALHRAVRPRRGTARSCGRAPPSSPSTADSR